MDPLAVNFDPLSKKTCTSCCLYESTDSSANVYFQLKHLAGSEELNFLFPYFAPDGRVFKINSLKYYISNISFIRKDGTKELIENKIIYITLDSLRIFIGNIDPGNYTGLEFCIGLDSLTNETIPTDYDNHHPLGENNILMFWPNGLGYQFLQMAGQVDTSIVADSLVDSDFLIQIGTNPLKRSVNLDLAFTAGNNENLYFSLSADYRNLLTGLDLQSEHSTQTIVNPAVANKIADNIPTVFSISSF